MANSLNTEQPRVGTCWHEGRREGFPAMLWNPGSEIQLVVSYDHEDELHRRFHGRGVNWGDDPDYSRYEYGFPEEVWFADTHGHVSLIGPHRPSGTLVGVPEEGRVRFRYAVFGGDHGVSYSRVHRMRSRINGLEDWMPLGSISHQRVANDGEHLDELTLRRQQPVRFDRRLNASLDPSYSFTISPSPGRSSVGDEVQINTQAQRSHTWREHLEQHLIIKDLLMVSGWNKHDLWRLEVRHYRDPVRYLSGDSAHPRWAPVFAPNVTAEVEHSGRYRFLFDYNEIGATGLRRWTGLHHRFFRGIAGMLHSLEQPGAVLESQFADTGAALEWIGHKIALEHGDAPGQWLQGHLQRIVEEIHADPGFSLADWSARFASLYNDVKHPDRTDPDALTLANGLREARLVFRFWVATRLGMRKALLQRNLGLIPMRTPYTWQ